MPNIVPISDLRNYNEVLKKVDIHSPVYLTRNGRGTFVISRIDDYDKETMAAGLLKEITQGEQSLAQGKAIPIARIAKRLDIDI